MGGTVLNTLKGGGTKKRRGEAKILKRGEKARSKVGCLKKRVAGTPLRIMLPLQKHTALKQKKLILTTIRTLKKSSITEDSLSDFPKPISIFFKSHFN